MSKISLTNLVNLQNETTAVNAINANNAVLTAALDNTLSRDGTSPNTMNATLDMNSQAIINLPAPISTNSPLRLADANTLNGGGTIQALPVGGTTAQVLAKTSNTDYAVGWTSATSVVAGTNISVTGTPSTIATVNNPTFSTSVTTPLLVNTGTLTLPTTSDTLIGRATTDTLTNKTFDTAGVGNSFKINGTAITANTGTGSNVLATSPTLATATLTSPVLTTPAIGAATGTSIVLTGGDISFATSGRGHIGTTTNDNANTGNVGEYVEAILASGSALALTTTTPKNIVSISLSAGDWDVDAVVQFTGGATTTVSFISGGLSTTTATLDLTAGRTVSIAYLGNAAFNASVNPLSIAVPALRFSLATTTTIFMIAESTFATSTASAFGILRARRIR